MNAGDAFIAEAVATNESGRLTPDQQRAWRGQSRGVRKGELSFAALLTVLGLLVWFAPGPARYATWKPIIGIAALLIAAFLLWRALTGEDRITEDVRAGAVQSIDGAITRHSVSTRSGSASTESFYFDVAGKRFQVSRSWYEMAPEAGYVRIFYLPLSHRVVNMVRLPDPPVADITPASGQQLLHDSLTAVRSHDEQRMAEVRAEGAAMADKFQEQLHQAAVPPPPDQLDPRPLAQAIVGSWSNAFMSVVFGSDGAASATLPGGRTMSGRWSVGADGQVHVEGVGPGGAASAWVAGDVLTISEGGRGLTFNRTSS